MKILSRHIIVFVLICLVSCLEPFEPDVSDQSESLLVVDGIITNGFGPYIVKLTKSSSLKEMNTVVTGANVSIEEMNGPTNLMVEASPGVYETNTLQGSVGKSYRLLINYQGQQYQSSWETILNSPPIDSVYYQVGTRPTTDKDIDIVGVEFFVDNHGPEVGTRYFRYEYEETWRIGVSYPANFDYLGDDLIQTTTNPLFTCWKNGNSNSINIATTTGLVQNVLSGHSLGFIARDDERYTERYSMLVKQFALEEEEYLFWKSLKESNEELGSLFDKQPANVVSNVTNINNPAEIVLGYFSASGFQEVRIYIHHTEVPTALSLRPSCGQLDSLYKAELGTEYETTIFRRIANGSFFFDLIVPDLSPNVIGVMLSPPRCTDCTSKGGDLNKPEFWDE